MNYLQRKKLAFMKVVNSVKGFVRIIAGILPLTLPNCVDNESVINYSIYGNSMQSDIPTPANPIEIESVGVRSSNILPFPYKTKTSTVNGITFTMNDDGSVLVNGTAKAAATVYLYQNTTTLLPTMKSGDTVAVSKFCDDDTQRGLVYFICNYYNEAGSMKQGPMASTSLNAYATVTEDWKGIGAYLHVPSGNTINNLLVKPKVAIGKPATGWEPYGYKIPVVTRGKNICPNDWELGFISPTTGENTTGNTSNIRTKGYFTFDKNQVYFISSNDLTDTNNITWYFYDENKTFISRAASKRNRTVSVTTNNTQVKIPENAVYYRLVVNVTNVDIKVQLELGTSATEYEPYKEPITTDIYLDEPLMGIGKAFDYIDFENQKVVRKIGNCLLGVSARREINHDTLISYYYLVPDKTKVADTTIVEVLSPSLLGIPRNKNITLYNTPAVSSNANNTAVFYYLYRDDVGGDTDALVKAYLQANPITIYYELATPIEESISLPTLPTLEGTTVYEIDTEVQPSNMEVTYYSSQKGE